MSEDGELFNEDRERRDGDEMQREKEIHENICGSETGIVVFTHNVSPVAKSHRICFTSVRYGGDASAPPCHGAASVCTGAAAATDEPHFVGHVYDRFVVGRAAAAAASAGAGELGFLGPVYAGVVAGGDGGGLGGDDGDDVGGGYDASEGNGAGAGGGDGGGGVG